MHEQTNDPETIRLNTIRDFFLKKQTPLHQARLLRKARQYHIPYQKDEINWAWLTDSINNYEELIKEASFYYLNWDFSSYNPIELEEALEAHKQKEKSEARGLLRQYLGSIL